jgi:hypothetical protein
MKKGNILILILLIVIVFLGLLDLMWIADLNEYEQDSKVIDNKELSFTPLLGKTKTFEVSIHEGRLNPYTMKANLGDRIILSFASDEPIDFELDAFGISEKINLGNIVVNVDKQGVFTYICLSCEEKTPGYLIVN